MMNEHQTRRIIWPLLIFFCVIWFYALGARTLVPTDEGRYAEMAREMVATGDWITPRLNAIKYFEKPPLQVWMTALTFKFFGLGDWQARLWTGLCGLFGIALTAYTGRKVFSERVGLTAGLVLASSFLWAGLGHINTLDMGLSGMMTLALCSLLLGQSAKEAIARRRWMLWCWAGMALSVMSKGLIGLVLPGAVLVLYTFFSRDWAIWKRLQLLPGLLVFFAITTPWFVLVSLQNPEFPHFFFIHEHFQRFTSKIHRREGPWYYFVPILVLGVLPWLTVTAQSLWHSARRERSGFQPQKLLLVWVVFIFFFFSISRSKLPSYILPIFPALALLIALHLENAGRKTWLAAAGFTTLLGAVGLALVPMIAGWTKEPLDLEHYRAAQPWALAAAVVLLASGATLLWSMRQGRQHDVLPATLKLAIGGFLAGQLAMLATEPYGNYRSGLPMVAAIQAELTPQMTIYSVGMYDQTLPYYLRRTMTLVQHPDELEFGLEQEPQLWLPTIDAFLVKWANGTKAIAITRPEVYAELQQRGVAMRVVTRDSRRVVLANDLKQ